MSRILGDAATLQAYDLARARYASQGVDTEKALATLADISLSLQCWQGDDVGGFESRGSPADGGIMATGSHPGRARTPGELRADLSKALSLIPGKHRVNLHAMYLDTNEESVERNRLEPRHFEGWVQWAEERGVALDFNPTFFAHPNVRGGFTLASTDSSVRRFWVEHGIACRKIGEYFGRELKIPCITNFWIPDGYKDTPVDRIGPRKRLLESLDEIFAAQIDPAFNRDAVESKLFGIGSESYVVGSHEFYTAYALRTGKIICLDTGHFHPTESIADKVSSLLLFANELLLHVSRGVRWDSDHIVVLDDQVKAIAREVVRPEHLPRVHIALDYFDASVNRVAAWVIGMRSTLKGLLGALLEPAQRLADLEAAGDLTGRLGLQEEIKTLPMGAVWDYYCANWEVPLEGLWLDQVREHEKCVLAKRG